MGLLITTLGVLFLYNHKATPSHPHFAIIPHFMLASEKVDEFYAFLKDKRYAENDPETIIIVSPNHFNQHSTTPQTICCIPLIGGTEGGCEVYFRNQKYQLTPFPNTACDENIFYLFGNSLTTNEHGIGEHLPRITKHFPTTKTIIPLILPTHKQPTQVTVPLDKGEGGGRAKFRTTEGGLQKRTLTIASVDFSHYLPETTARTNDQISIATLESWTWTRPDFRRLDVDCPSCLYLIDQITRNEQSAKLYRRDSSSTILSRDMQSENTSRVFMYYE